jgi:hypothetical protein
LFAGSQVNSAELLDVVPPLHQFFVRSGAESVGVVALAQSRQGLDIGGLGRDVELVRLGCLGGRCAQGAFRQEETEFGGWVLGSVGATVFVQVTGRGEDVEALLVRLGESLLSLEDSLVNGNDRGVILSGVVDGLWVSQRRIGVQEVVASSSKCNPLGIWLQASHLDSQSEPSLLDLSRHSAAPLVERLPSTLDASDNAFFKVSTVLLHDDNALLESIFLIDLTLQLSEYLHVGRVRVLLGSHTHGGVLEQGNGAGKIRDHLGGQFAFLGNTVGQFTGVLLHILDMSLDLGSQLLQVLNNGSLDSLCQVGVVVGNDTGLFSNAVEDVLDTIFTQELVSFTERNLNNTSQLRQLARSVVFNVTDSGEVGNKLLGNVLPACNTSKEKLSVKSFFELLFRSQTLVHVLLTSKSFNQQIGRSQFMWASVLLDQAGISTGNGRFAAHA